MTIFNPSHIGLYSSDELLAFAREGQNVPADALVRVKKRENDAAELATVEAEVAALIAAAEADAAAARDALKAQIPPMIAEYETAAAAAAEEGVKYRAAKRAYLVAHGAAQAKFIALRDFVGKNFPEDDPDTRLTPIGGGIIIDGGEPMHLQRDY